MSFLDRAKQAAESAKDAAADHADQVRSGIDKVGDVIDDKTGGKYSDKIDSATDKAGDYVDTLDDKA